MSLIFTPLAADNFTPDANPLNPAKWTPSSDIVSFSDLEASGGYAICSQTLIDCTGFYTGVPTPVNQYATVKLASIDLSIMNAGFYFPLRSSSDENDQYTVYCYSSGDSSTVDLGCSRLIGGSEVTLKDVPSSPFAQGDVFTAAIVGSSIYMFQNGVQIFKVTDTTFASAGMIGIDIASEADTSSVKLTNFIIGSVSSGGPVTVGTVFPGPYYGSSLATAFPNVQKLDIMQVVNEGGKTVWNLNYLGVATTNPTNPTPGTLLGVFEGRNFAAAFPNPYQLNVFQVVGPGGAVVFHVDYQGNAVTP